jgi:hypothetical protein
MDLTNRTVLILGGSGLVGQAVARVILARKPAKLVLVALHEQEVRDAARALDPWRGGTTIVVDWGNVFVPEAVARTDREAMLADAVMRRLVIDDLYGDLTDAVMQRSPLHRLFETHRPDAVVDGINTATAFAYQDVFTSARDLMTQSAKGLSPEQVEGHVLTLTMPQLIRHTQIMAELLRRYPVMAYVKIGTSGTGGMGLNIPYTHSEERPSRTMLTKSAVGGAQSLLLFLLGRTPGIGSVAEVKPTATIGWREIAYGPVPRRGKPIAMVDCPKPLALDVAFTAQATGWKDLGRPLESVYVNMGENGAFAPDEFETVTALGSMELITAEDVADYVVMELEGRPTGRDIVAALDSATAGPTYRAGILRQHAIDRLRALEAEHGVRAVGFEMLGPPRLTKILYEAHILGQLCSSVRTLASATPEKLAKEAQALVAADEGLRRLIISVGLPIVVPEGVYRGSVVIVPPEGDVEKAIPRGWVDLRGPNCGTWIRRAVAVVAQADARAALAGQSGSDVPWGAMEGEDAIAPSRFAAWIFANEDDGERIKR